MAGHRNRKHGNKKNKPTFVRYWASQRGFANRRALHKAQAVARFARMVAESRARRGAMAWIDITAVATASATATLWESSR